MTRQRSPKTIIALTLAVLSVLLVATRPAQAQTVVATVPVGQIPQSIAVNPVTNKIYVANLGSGDVTVINGATDSTITLTDPNANFLQSVAVNPVTNMIYVANFNSNNVTVIDGASNSITTVTDPNAIGPNELAVNPVTNKIYVANWLSDTVTVIDGATNSTVSVPTGTNPHFVAINTVTNMIYVPNWGSGDVTVIDGATNSTITVRDPNASVASNAAVNSVTNKIYISNYGSNNVTVIDGDTNSTTTVTDPNAVHPSVVVLNQLTNKVYIVNGGSGPYAGSDNVTIIDGATNSTTTVADPNAKDADCVVLDPVANKVYVSNWASNNITVIDGVTNSIRTISDSSAVSPNQMAVDSNTERVYVANGGGYPYGGSNNVTVIAEVNLTQTSTALVSNLNPAIYGQSITFTAAVSSTSGAPPNGETVTFYNGSAVLGTASLSAGIASLTTSSLPTGIYTITAAYGGDSTFASSTSPPLRQAVNSTTKSATATALVSSLNPSIYGQRVSWTATVTAAGPIMPTGTVAFTWAGHTIGTAKLNANGVATLTRSDLNADSYPLTALYKGDANNLGSTSPILNQVVRQTTSSATLTSSPNPSTTGVPVTFTAKISSLTVTALGPVTFTAGKTMLGTAELSRGKATFTTSTLATGSTTVTATYPGDSNIQGSSALVTQIVQQSIGSGSSSTALTYTENPSTLTEAFNATVTSSSGTPTGTVTFTVGSTTLGTIALTSGQAILNTTTLAVGSNTVTATYSGNSQIEPSSAWVTQTFVMPVNGTLYLQQEGGSAGATTTFGLGTSSANFVPYYTGLPNSPNPTGELQVGTFPAGTLINFGMYTTFGSQSGYAFSTGTDQASLVSFADLSNSLGMDHGITQQTGPTTWVLHLDDALSYLYDDDNNDVLMELIVVPN